MQTNITKYRSPIAPSFLAGSIYYFDCSEANDDLTSGRLNPLNTQEFQDYLSAHLGSHSLGIGKYAEDRTPMVRNTLFEREGRVMHMGLDLFLPARTPLYAVQDATVHKVGYEEEPKSYGNYLLLKSLDFFILYGHLASHPALVDGYILQEGDRIKSGDQIARVGDFTQNGDWPTHLHLQLATSLPAGKIMPQGMVRKTDLAYYKKIYPDPSFLLQLS